MLKPIEPGCLAITINCLRPENNGNAVRVLRYAGVIEWAIRGLQPSWETDTVLLSYTGAVASPICPEWQLLRIDGFDESEDTETATDKAITTC